MMPEDLYGCVVLLDALGMRTVSIEQTKSYLAALADIREVMSEFAITEETSHGREMPEHPGGEFSIRFFADSILITLPVEREHMNWAPIARTFSGTGAVLATAFNRGILFRGAIAIGNYIETNDAVLGPAILDAAHWYETANMFGVFATPNAMFTIRRLLCDREDIESWAIGAVESTGLPYEVPLNSGLTIDTHMVDWSFSAGVRSRDAAHDIEKWFYKVLERYPVTPDVELKYRNTLSFLNHCQTRRKKRLISQD
jgi:hypothetical protein